MDNSERDAKRKPEIILPLAVKETGSKYTRRAKNGDRVVVEENGRPVKLNGADVKAITDSDVETAAETHREIGTSEVEQRGPVRIRECTLLLCLEVRPGHASENSGERLEVL